MIYPIVRQIESNDCGPACLAMVAAYYGKPLPLPVLGQHAGTDRNGTSLGGLLRAAALAGIPGRGVRASPGTLGAVALPAIAHWCERGRPHFVVVYEVTRTRTVIGDPAVGLRRLPRARFCRYWTGVLLIFDREAAGRGDAGRDAGTRPHADQRRP